MNFILKYFSFRKCWNLLKLRFGYRLSSLLRMPIVLGSPAFLQIEPLNFCNLRCVECPAGNGSLTRKKQEMSFDLFRKNIDEIGKNLISLLLYFQGEPFLYKNLPQMVKYAHERKIFTYTSTNGHYLLDSLLLESLIKSGLDHLVVSVDGMTQDVYEKYRRGGNLQKVLDGIDNLIFLKEKNRSATPTIEVQMVVTAENEHQTDDFLRFFKDKKVQKVSLKSAQIYDFENGNPLIPKNAQFSRYEKCDDGKYKLKSSLRNCCWKQWSSAVVTASGDLVPCCFDKNAEHKFGNVSTENLLSLWKNSVSHNFRKTILHQRKSIDICCNCSEK